MDWIESVDDKRCEDVFSTSIDESVFIKEADLLGLTRWSLFI